MAGYSQRFLYRQWSVYSGAGYDVTPNFISAGAGKGPVIQIFYIFNGSCCCDQFISWTRRIGGRQKAVNIYTFITAVIIWNLRRIYRIIGGRRDHTKDFAGFIIINTDSTLSSRLVLHTQQHLIQINGQIQFSAVTVQIVRTENRSYPISCAAKRTSAGSDVSGAVPDRMECSHSDWFVIRINSTSVLNCWQNDTVSVQYSSDL